MSLATGGFCCCGEWACAAGPTADEETIRSAGSSLVLSTALEGLGWVRLLGSGEGREWETPEPLTGLIEAPVVVVVADVALVVAVAAGVVIAVEHASFSCCNSCC